MSFKIALGDIVFTFISSILGKPSALHDRNNPDWIPTLNLGHARFQSGVGSVERYNRQQSRIKRKGEPNTQDEEKAAKQVCTSPDITGVEEPPIQNTDCQTDLSGTDIKMLHDECHALQEEVQMLRRANANLICGTEAFFDSDEKVLFYTGLPNKKLLNILFIIVFYPNVYSLP